MSSSEFMQALLRLQFGLSAGFHFLFVPLSMGLLLFVCLLRTAHVKNGLQHAEVAAGYWQRFFLITWLTGMATGYPLRSQLQENWAGYTQAASAVLVEIFKIEGVVAPWMFGAVLVLTLAARYLSSRWMMLVSWLLLGLMSVQALTILSVNAWMQVPAGVRFEQGAWQVSALTDILLSPTALHKWAHTLSGAMLCGTFFVWVISAAHLRQPAHQAAARVSMRLASWVGLGAVVLSLLSGHESAALTARTQPMKFAAFEAHWRAEPGPAGLVAWGMPDDQRQANAHEFRIPYLLTWLTPGPTASPPGILDLEGGYVQHLQSIWMSAPGAFNTRGSVPGMDAELRWLDRPEDRGWLLLRDAVAAQHPQAWALWSSQVQMVAVASAARPPVAPLFWAFRLMVGCGLACLVLCVLAFVHRVALSEGQRPALLKALSWAVPLPWVAILSGWLVAEVGRQPWTIYGQLPTFRASVHPPLEAGVAGAFALVLAAVLIAAVYIALIKQIWQAGPTGNPWPIRRWLARWNSTWDTPQAVPDEDDPRSEDGLL